MRIVRVDLRVVRLPLIRRFRTSSSTRSHLDHVLLRIETDEGVTGWGECASPPDPYYCEETTQTAWHILADFLVPAVLGRSWLSPEHVPPLYHKVKGNYFAKAGLEMACWDAFARATEKPLASLLGGTRPQIESGVSLGIETDPEASFSQIDQYLEEGYKRVKLKIAPGHDVSIVRAVRSRYPSLPLQVDANSAYSLDDARTLKALDDFNLLMIEQPLAYDDIIDHAKLQAQLKTPICLDESIRSVHHARQAIELGSCRVINIKVGRVGGLAEARRIHDLCLREKIPVWCGGMHEFGIGRAANVAISSLEGFTIPGDVSGSDKYYAEDLVDPPILAHQGAIPVPSTPGLGYSPVASRIDRYTTRLLSLPAT